MAEPSSYDRALWAWFLAKAQVHNVYYWMPQPPQMVEHLRSCGIDMSSSDLPDVGAVSEFADTESPNIELDAITSDHWQCLCGKYGSASSQWDRVGGYLAVPGPYPLGLLIAEAVAYEEGRS